MGKSVGLSVLSVLLESSEVDILVGIIVGEAVGKYVGG